MEVKSIVELLYKLVFDIYTTILDCLSFVELVLIHSLLLYLVKGI
jgi:hypothetical protein